MDEETKQTILEKFRNDTQQDVEHLLRVLGIYLGKAEAIDPSPELAAELRSKMIKSISDQLA